MRYDEPVGHVNFGKVEPCPQCYAKNMAVRKRFAGQNLVGDLANYTFENFDPAGNKEAYTRCVEFAAKPVGMLTLWGGYGRGKTHLLAAIHNRLLEYDVAAKYFSFPDWTSELRRQVGDEAADPEAFYQYVSQFPIILVDDIDFADIRRWTREQVFRLFNLRYLSHKQVGTALAMNFNPNQDSDLGWLFSRLTDERQVVVQVNGEDNRGRVTLLQRLAKAKQAFAGGGK